MLSAGYKTKEEKVSQCLWGQISSLVLLPQSNQLYSSNKYTNYRRVFSLEMACKKPHII